jgi:polysaccharide export outer membrane protein
MRIFSDRFEHFAARAALMLMLALAALLVIAPAASAQDAGDYHIGPGDLLEIKVYRADDLEATVRVSDKGTIVIPQLGEVKVAGLNPSQAGEQIASLLKSRGVFLNPSVNVLVTEYRSKTVAVLGAVSRPGVIPLDKPGMTIADVLARAGANFGSPGMIVTAVSGPAGATHREEFTVRDLISGGRDRPVLAGEQIFMQEPATFYISGEVSKAGAYPLAPGLTIGQAVALGGGLTPRGSASRISVTRNDAAGNPVKVKSVKQNVPVQAGDLIVVGARWF